MNPPHYQTFTDTLRRTLDRDPRVIGLMAAGSMADQSHAPDEWSDHDFWVVVEPGAAADFHARRDWLPEGDQIVLLIREQHGGFKAIYRSGHLLEFAVTGRAELLTARVNDYRLLIDRANLAADLARMQRDTAAEFVAFVQDDLCLLGQFLTSLLVGVGRLRRGERICARQLITVQALGPLWRLIAKHVPGGHLAVLDNLDPLRRVEMAYPEIGAEMNALLQLDLDAAARGLLDLADRLLRARLADYPAEAVMVVRRVIEG
jgi:hypothetical protein